MKKRRLSIILVSVLLLFVLAGCTTNSGEKYKEITGIDLSDYKPLSVYDTHGGFHGDGLKCEIYDCSNTDIENTIKNSHVWKQIPFSPNIETLLYETIGENKADSGKTFVPQIKKAFILFMTDTPRQKIHVTIQKYSTEVLSIYHWQCMMPIIKCCIILNLTHKKT